MKILIKITAFVIILLLTSTFIPALAQGNTIGSISARSACLVDADSGKLLYSKNADKRMPMASTTKVMTAIVALESKVPLDTVIKIPKAAVGIEGSSVYLKEGESIALEDLLYSLLLASANDASVAIAIAVAGSEDAFVELMNKKARELGLSNTHFSNPHGLDDKEHYTTARELAQIMAYALQNESFMAICGTYKKVLQREGGTRLLVNHNRLLKSYKGVIAGKTGFTKKSGRCLVSLAEREGLRLICVTLDAPNDWADHTSLYDFGFSNYMRVHFEKISIEIPVISGEKSSVRAESQGSSSIMIQKSLADQIKFTLYAPRFIFADVEKGEMIGRAVYTCGGRVLASSPIYACEDIPKIHYGFNLIDWLKNIIKGLKEWKK